MPDEIKYDKYGMPIKTEKVQYDEYGMPIKKKDELDGSGDSIISSEDLGLETQYTFPEGTDTEKLYSVPDNTKTFRNNLLKNLPKQTPMSVEDFDYIVETSKNYDKLNNVDKAVEDWYVKKGGVSPRHKFGMFEYKTSKLVEKYNEKYANNQEVDYDSVKKQFNDEVDKIAYNHGLIYDDGKVKLTDIDKRIYSSLYQDELNKESEREKPTFFYEVARKLDRSLYEAGLGLREIAGKIFMLDLISDYRDYNDEAREYLDIQQDLDSYNTLYDLSAEKYLEKGDFASAAGVATLSAIESLPSLILMASNPTYGLMTGGLLAANEKDEQLKEMDVNDYVRGLNVISTGLLEVGTERLTTIPMLEKAKGAIIGGGEDIFKNNVQKSLRTTLQTGIRRAGIGSQDVFLEMASEGLNQYGQNFVEKVSFNPEKDIKEGVVDAMATAVVASGIIKSPNIAVDSKAMAKDIAKQALDKVGVDAFDVRTSKAMNDIANEYAEKKVEEELNDLGVPQYEIDGIKYDSKEDFLKEVSKYKGAETSPDIDIKNDEKTTQDVTDILEGRKDVEDALKEDKDIEEAKKAEEQLKEEQEPEYTIEGQKYDDIETFLREVSKYTGKEEVPNIEVKNDEKTSQDVTDILTNKKGVEDALQENKIIEEESLQKEEQTKKEVLTEKDLENGKKKITKEEQKLKEEKDEEVVNQKSTYATKEDFQNDFLSDEKVKTETGEETSVAEMNLRGFEVEHFSGGKMKMSTKLAAAKNIREGKTETTQAKELQAAIDEAYESGQFRAVWMATGGKTIRSDVNIGDIARPKTSKVVTKEVTETTKPEDVEVAGETFAEEVTPEDYKEYEKNAPKFEGSKPDSYTLNERVSDDQKKISVSVGINKENSIDVTKPGSRKKFNKLVDKRKQELADEFKKTFKKDIKNAIIERRRAINLQTFETNLYTHDLKTKLSESERKAVTFLLEGKGVPEGMVGEDVKEIYDNPSKDVKQVVEEIRDIYDKAWKYLAENTDKMSNEQVEDYVTHLWKIPDKKVSDVVSWFTTNNRFTKKRTIESIREGMEKFGLEPQTLDVADILRVYESARINAVENAKFIKEIKGLEKDGIKLIMKADEAPANWKSIDNPALNYNMYIPSSEGKVAKLIKQNYKVHPSIRPSLQVVLQSGVFDSDAFNNTMRAYENISGFMKKMNLSWSLFHHMALTETAVATMGLPKTLKVLGKDLVYDGSTGKGMPAFKNPEIARDAVNHMVQLGATADIPVVEIQRGLSKLAEQTKDITGVAELTKALAKANEGWDRALWDYLHDGLKVYGFEHLANKVRDKALKENWTEEKTNKELDEIGQLINDTFGGQNWDVLGVSKQSLRMLRWLFLSPDWTYSTVRQALSVTGFGRLYKDDNFWNAVGSTRADVGRKFWLKAALYYGVGMNILNATFRAKDKEDNPEYYKDAEESNIKDLSMFNNTLGNKTYLFIGRDENGYEQYLRWGKQFRELPELFSDEAGFSIPAPAFKKLGSKANPALQTVVTLFSGKSLSGYENWDLKDKKGWDKSVAMLKTVGQSFMPFMTSSIFRKDKKWRPVELAMPTAKGMTKGKAIDLFEGGMDFKNGFSYDLPYLYEVYDGAIQNGVDALDAFNIAIRNKESEISYQLKEGVSSLEDIDEKIREAKTIAEKKKLMKMKSDKLKERAMLMKARASYVKVISTLTKKQIEYTETE